jgi:hypothetical protein
MGYGRLDFENNLKKFEEYLINKKMVWELLKINLGLSQVFLCWFSKYEKQIS